MGRLRSRLDKIDRQMNAARPRTYLVVHRCPDDPERGDEAEKMAEKARLEAEGFDVSLVVVHWVNEGPAL